MLGWMPELDESRPFRVLCLGAHSDDIEIGCGATLLEILRAGTPVDVQWVVFSGNGSRAEEARNSAEHWLRDADQSEIIIHAFKDGFFPDEWARIKGVFEEIKASFNPDLILTHGEADRHQDHRIICELTWNTFRNHSILEYEIPKYDGDLHTPSVYVPVSEEAAKNKVDALMNYFGSQAGKHWFCEELFLGLMRVRGIECCSPSGYAEGFHARKTVVRL